MAFSSSIKVTGGKKLEKILKAAEANKNKKTKVKVGFFSDAKYEDGESIANVAAIQEFGAQGQGIPERPFFRKSIAIIDNDLPKKLPNMVDPETMAPDLDAVGAYAVDVIKDSIADLKRPPNAPSTIMLKKSGDPLIDSGQLHDAPRYEVQ